MRMRWPLAALCVAASLSWPAWKWVQPTASAELTASHSERRLFGARLAEGAIRGQVARGKAADLHAQAVSLLLRPRGQGPVDQAVARLREAAERAPEDARILNDLAVAWFVRARQNDQPADLLLALAAADRAVRADGNLLEARFNRALLLEETFLPTDAWFAWQDYLDRDGESGWARMAEARLRELRQPSAAEVWGQERELLSAAALRQDPEAVAEIVARFRQPARQYAEDTLLAGWAEARIAGDLHEADRSLDLARAIGNALVGLGGDAMVHDAVAAIDRARSTPASGHLQDLIEGHRAYGRGLLSLRRMEIIEAAPQLRQAVRALAAAGSPFVHWARLQLASCDFFHEKFGEARRSLEEIDRAQPHDRYPALRGRVHFIIGSIDGLQGRPGDSLERWARARELFRNAGDVENQATIDQHFAIGLGALGSEDAWRSLFRALRQLHQIQTPRRVFAILDEAGIASLRQGQPEVALYFQNELLSFARRQRDPEQIASALQRRADTFTASGRTEEAGADLDAAARQADRIADAKIRGRMKAHIALSRGQADLASAPDLAVRELTEAIGFFERSSYHFYLSLARFLRARAYLAAGERAVAGEDFQAGLREIESSRENLSDERLRIRFADQATQLFDEILSFEAEKEGGAVTAFDLAEQTRARELLEDMAVASLAEHPPAAGARPRLLPFAELRRALPERTLVLKYAVLPDRVLLWSITRRELEFHAIAIDPRSLEGRVRQVRSALRTDQREQVARDLGALYALLIGPAERAVRGAEDIVVIPDKSLHLLPFAALVEPRSGRYLVQDHALAVAPSVNVYVRCLVRGRRSGPPETALVVGDPSFDRRDFPSLVRLPGAKAEAEQIAEMYPRSDLLTGDEATPRSLLAQMARGPEVLQISAHSIFSPAHPEYSRLVLARDAESSGSFYMHQVPELDLRHTRLVVLAGCGTGAGRISVSEGSISFARSFLAAGVPSVLASLWNVDDEASRDLLTDFHRHLRSGEEPMSALRHAQLARLEAPGETGPSWTWAAYEFIGGSLPATKEGKQ